MRKGILALAVLAALAAPFFFSGTVLAGQLTVNINPVEAVRAGAAWSVDYGRTWFQSGQAVNLPPGKFVVVFKEIPGWRTPKEHSLSLGERVRSTIEVEYGRSLRGGRLKVVINPPEVATMGASWSLDNGQTWYPSGAEVALPAGTHTIIFQSLGGWGTPLPMTVTLADGESMEVGSTYGTIITGPSGVLRVIIRPADAVKAGAQWSVDSGHTWFLHNSGLRLEPGEYRVIFKDVPGWVTPRPRKATVKKDKETKEHANYQK